MRGTVSTLLWFRLLMILLLLLPLVLLFLLPGAPQVAVLPWFWLTLLITLGVIWLLLGSAAAGNPAASSTDAGGAAPPPRPTTRMLYPDEQPAVLREVMDVETAVEREGVQQFRGRLIAPREEVFPRLRQALPEGTVPLVQEDAREEAVILLMPRPVEEQTLEQPSRPTIHWVLFGLTVLTTTWAGAAHQGVNLLEEPSRFAVGLPYAIGLMAILGLHELGHFFTARHHGIRVTPPYFIPVPFALGTFGAFIAMKSPTENRRALFDVAVAGPLAGLVIAIPALMIGLQGSEVLTDGAQLEQGQLISLRGTSVGSSVLLSLIASVAMPQALQQGCTVRFSPLAFAGWLGLLVTALNLLPIGQLDGGHIARAMFGTRIGSSISTLAMWSLFLLALFVWPALMMWAIIVFFIAGRGTPPLDDLSEIGPGRRLLGYVSFAILLAILLPMPQALMSQMGIHCPYA